MYCGKALRRKQGGGEEQDGAEEGAKQGHILSKSDSRVPRGGPEQELHRVPPSPQPPLGDKGLPLLVLVSLWLQTDQLERGSCSLTRAMLQRREQP